MRNFEARKAEIMRRSAERIKKRKQIRNRIVAACIPLVICAAVGAAVSFPASEPCEVHSQLSDTVTAMGGPAGTNSNYSAVSPESVTVSAEAVVRVYSGDVLCTVAWDEDAEKIAQLISDIFTDGKDMVTCDTARSEVNEQKTHSVYTISLTDAAGSQTQYFWDGEVLRSADAEIGCALTVAQKEALAEALNIPES